MKKTNYTMIVEASYTTATYRRVWKDENGEYFVKHNGKIKNVTFAKEDFIED